MRAWLRRGAAAAQRAADRADLWPAGALASLVFLGWVPLLLAVAQVDAGDLTFFASSLRASSAFPANVVALGVSVVAGVLMLCVLAATAEAALVRASSPADVPEPRFSESALVGLAVVLVCALPAAAAAATLLLAAVALVPAEVQAPDLGVPLVLRVAGVLLPFLVFLLLAILAGQVVGGSALGPALASGAPPVGLVLGRAVRDLVRRPWGRVGVAAAGLLADLVAVALTFAVLRVLWAPIAAELGAGRLGRPETILLLVGFVAIWLALLLAAGAVHVAVSTWWVLELADSRVPTRDAAVASRPDARGGTTD